MRPISELTIGYIGKRVRIVDPGVTLTGTLFGIDAEREAICDTFMGGEEMLTAGAWENLTFTVGSNRVNLGPDAEWEAL